MIDDNRLEEMLRESKPQQIDGAALRADSARIVRQARTRHRHVRIWGAGAAAALLLFGGGSAALAGAGVTPWGWFADNSHAIENPDGSLCFQGFRITHTGLAEDAPIVRDAVEILQGIDADALDTTQTERDIARDSPTALTPDALRQDAIGTMVAKRLFDELAARGHDVNPSPVGVHAQVEGCE